MSAALALLVLTVVAPCATAAAATRAAPVRCDRQCLIAAADDYFAALLSHSPSGLPLDESVRMTENAVPVSIGQGVLWRRLSKGPSAYRIDVVDVPSQQIAVGTRVEIDGHPNLLALRLKLTGDRIVEIEQLFSDGIQPVGLPNLDRPREALLSDVSPTNRSTRGDMQLIVESYFDALTSEDSRRAPIADDCVRHEGGIRTTGNRQPLELAMPASAPAAERERMRIVIRRMTTLGCAGQIDSGLFADLHKVWPRRPIVIDEEKGLVASFPLFIQNGDVRPSPLKGYSGVDRLPNPTPSASQKLEIFKVHSGAIHEIEAVVFVPLNYGAGNGWDAGAGQ